MSGRVAVSRRSRSQIRASATGFTGPDTLPRSVFRRILAGYRDGAAANLITGSLQGGPTSRRPSDSPRKMSRHYRELTRRTMHSWCVRRAQSKAISREPRASKFRTVSKTGAAQTYQWSVSHLSRVSSVHLQTEMRNGRFPWLAGFWRAVRKMIRRREYFAPCSSQLCGRL